MAWHYAVNNEQQGPVDQPEWEQLIRQGVVTEDTLVWQEGMADWQPYRDVTASPAIAPPGLSLSSTSGVVCSECGKRFALHEVIRIANRNVCGQCKPIATQKLLEGVTDSNSAEQIRKDHLKHEASVKSIGILYLLSATIMTLGGLAGVASSFSGGGQSSEGPWLGIVLLGLAAVQIVTGLGLRRLKLWTRIPSGIISGIGLLAFPIGTLINGYILYLLFSKKGAMVFSKEYKQIIEQTPHVKYRTSILVWIALIVFILLIVLVSIYALRSAPR